jgi:hypothetical protein
MKDFKKVLNEALGVPEPTPVQPVSINEEEQKAKTIDRLVDKLGRCIDYQSVYALEEEFNKAGLTIQTTSNSRMVLCRLQEGKPIAQNVVDDYIFIGSLDAAINELTDRAVMKMCDFVRTNASTADKVRNTARVWRNGLKMYESTIAIMNEDKHAAAALIESNPPKPLIESVDNDDPIRLIAESVDEEDRI